MKPDEFFTEWLSIESVLLQRSTYEAYTIYINKHIIPYFQKLNIQLEDIKPIHIQGYVKYKLQGGRKDGKQGGLSPVSVKKHLSIIKQALNEAVVYGYIPSNPALYVKIPRLKDNLTKRTVFLSADEAQKMLEAVKGHNIYVAVVLSLYYGLRRSEVLGLKWSAVDFKKNTITINHTIVKNLTIEAKDSTKTAQSTRTFQLLPEVKEVLTEAKKEAYGEYINSWTNGKTFRPDYVTRAFQRELKRHGLPKMRFHDLRHSTASILFDKGWQLEDIKNWLGHRDIVTTSNIYVHYGRGRKILLANNLQGTFKI